MTRRVYRQKGSEESILARIDGGLGIHIYVGDNYFLPDDLSPARFCCLKIMSRSCTRGWGDGSQMLFSLFTFTKFC